MANQNDAAIDINLHSKQQVAFNSTATEILYGGAAGGGKSHLMRMAAVMWCAEIPGLQVYLFRRIRDDLIKNHMEGPSGFRAVLAGWVQCGFVTIVEDEIRFWNGSKIYLCHCKDEKDRFKYQGAEIHVLLIDELTHFTEVIYRFLRNRVRMVGIQLPTKYEGCFPRIVSGANPGGVGHQFVKATFIDNCIPLAVEKAANDEGGMLRQYIPARLEDNPSMAENDPGYEARLEGLGSESLVRAMRWGDWDIVEGAFFAEFTKIRHVIEPFTIPKDWLRFRSMDWGSAKPFSVGWWAVASDDYELPDGRSIPRGAMVRYREWYGCVKGKPDTGLKMTAKEVAIGIKSREEAETIAYGVLDPAAFSQDGGPSHAEEMATQAIYFDRADNKRVPQHGALGGWNQMRQRLRGEIISEPGEFPIEYGRPMLFVFSTCLDFIRTIPSLQHDEKRAEDLDTNMEDHVADEARYGCMSRPWAAPAPQPAKPRDRYRDKKQQTRASGWAS